MTVATPDQAPATPLQVGQGALSRASDWLNPILVKEVRQALRGRYFKVCFWVTLLAVAIVTTGMMVASIDDGKMSGNEGREFFFSVYLCLTIAVVGLVPFSAFNAMGAEWDENTYDLLIISNLKPRSIVLGKLLSTSVQSLLFYSAFTPYLVFSSLLQRVDLIAVVTLIVGTFLLSTGLSILALCLSTLTRVRFARIILMAVLAALLVQVCFGAVGLGFGIINDPGELQSRDGQMLTVMLVLVTAIVSTFAFVIATVMLSHPEENRSTGLRVLTTLTVVTAVLWMNHAVGFLRVELVSGFTIGFLASLLLPSVFMATEPEPLGRRVAPRVPKNPLLALLWTPFLPGGARGFLHFLLNLSILVLGSFWVKSSSGVGFNELHHHGGLAVIAAALYAFLYVGLPSALLAPFSAQPNLRTAARVTVPFLIATFAFVPAVVGWFIGDRGMRDMKHSGNPFYVFMRCWDGDVALPGVWALLLGLAALALLLNVRRMVTGFAEVLSASQERAARERQARESTNARGDSGGALA